MFYGHVLKLSLGVKSDNNILSSIDNTNENFISKNYDYHKNCVKELQAKLRYLEKRFNIVNLMLKSRDLTDEELKKVNIQELNEKNKEMNDEDFEINNETRTNIQLIAKMEEYFSEKKKIFEHKKQFMEHIQGIKKDSQAKLTELFNDLNMMEDEYTVSERAIENLQVSITLNQEEVLSMSEKTRAIEKEKKELELIHKNVEQELNECKTKEAELSKQVTELRAGIEEKSIKVNEELTKIQNVHNNILQNKLTFYENREKIIYIKDLKEEADKENEKLKENKSKVKRREIKDTKGKGNRVKRAVRELEEHRS